MKASINPAGIRDVQLLMESTNRKLSRCRLQRVGFGVRFDQWKFDDVSLDPLPRILTLEFAIWQLQLAWTSKR